MIYFKVIHKYKLRDRKEVKDIGIFSSYENAKNAVEVVKTKEGFRDTINGFRIKKIFKFIKPKVLDKIFWVDGFDTYIYRENINKKISCDNSLSLLNYFSFLVKEYNFKFDKVSLGDLKDETGKLWFYGPYNCYYFYNDVLCINFLNLVQRQDWWITITEKPSNCQKYIHDGKRIDKKYYYDWEFLASVMKTDIQSKKEIFGCSIE